MKPVQACLSTKKELESWFHHYGGTVILVYVHERSHKALLSSKKACEGRASLFKC